MNYVKSIKFAKKVAKLKMRNFNLDLHILVNSIGNAGEFATLLCISWKDAVNLKTGRFDNIGLDVIISSVCKAVQNCKFCLQFCTALRG